MKFIWSLLVVFSAIGAHVYADDTPELMPFRGTISSLTPSLEDLMPHGSCGIAAKRLQRNPEKPSVGSPSNGRRSNNVARDMITPFGTVERMIH